MAGKTQFLMKLGTLVDNVISVISPEIAERRSLWRRSYWGYEAGEMSRKDAVFPWDGRAEQMNKTSRKTIRSRARDLERNDPVIGGILAALTANVVGSGLNMQAASNDEEFNKTIEGLFREWMHPENCDATQRQSLTEMLNMIVRRYVIDGGILVIYSIDDKAEFPLSLQLREVDDFTSQDLPNINGGNIMSDGVEMTSYGRPVAYWLTQTDANGMETTVPVRIDADRADFLWSRVRPSQYREMSLLARIIVALSDLHDYNDAVAFQQKTAACTSVFIEQENQTGSPGRAVNTATGERLEKIQAGSVKYLRPGEKAKPLIPTGQAAEVENYLTTQLRMIAADQGLSLESATRNVSNVNYSSARQNLLADQKTYKIFRAYLIEHLLRPLYKRFVMSCYLKGLLNNTKFNPNDKSYFSATWLGEGLPWIDPKKEAEADAIKLLNGGLSFKEYCAQQGVDWRERLLDIAEVEEEAKRLGVKLNFITPEEQIERSEDDGEGQSKLDTN